VQLAPAARPVPQWSVNEKEDADAPVTVTLSMASGSVPLFVTVSVCGGLLVPTGNEPKLIEAGEISTEGELEPVDKLPAHPQIAAVLANTSSTLHR